MKGEPPELRITDPTDGARDSLEAGALIEGKYRLLECVGEGGMATVWVARNEALDSEVAIKFIRADASHTNLAERLLHEARAAAKLRHPSIVRIFDFGKTPQGAPYIVMERLVGDDLAAVFHSGGRMTAIAAVRTLLPIAHALAVAHDNGIVHRDLKPANIFLARAEDGQIQPKLLDFGVAQFHSFGSARLTEAGTTLGSPAYMSPEQALGEEVDASTDIWAFSVVLYEAISGAMPFREPKHNALMRQIIMDPPTPLSAPADGDEVLWRIIERGLEKPAPVRWPSMRAIGTALAYWLLERDVHEDLAGASLVTTWLQTRQSWVPSDDVLDRMQCEPGPKSMVLAPDSRQSSRPTASVRHPGTTRRSVPNHASASPSLAAASKRTARSRRAVPVASRRAVPRHAGIAALSALGMAGLVYLSLGVGAPRSTPDRPAATPMVAEAVAAEAVVTEGPLTRGLVTGGLVAGYVERGTEPRVTPADEPATPAASIHPSEACPPGPSARTRALVPRPARVSPWPAPRLVRPSVASSTSTPSARPTPSPPSRSEALEVKTTF